MLSVEAMWSCTVVGVIHAEVILEKNFLTLTILTSLLVFHLTHLVIETKEEYKNDFISLSTIFIKSNTKQKRLEKQSVKEHTCV